VGAETVERTFSFVDLAGFTALTEAHGDLDAVDLLDRFISLARDSLSAGDELVKSIGDAVMLATPGPGAAVAALAGHAGGGQVLVTSAVAFASDPGRYLISAGRKGA